jgi:hypothetical protein
MVAVFTPAASLQEITSDAAAPNNELLGKDDVRLPTDPATKTGTLVNGEVVTGGTSTATGTVVRIGADTVFVDVRGVAGGPFNAAEVLTGTTSGAVVTTNGAPTVPDDNAFRTGKRGVQ